MMTLSELQQKMKPSAPTSQLINKNWLNIGKLELDAEEPTIVRFLPDLLDDNNEEYWLYSQFSHGFKTDDGWQSQLCTYKHDNKTACPFCAKSMAAYDAKDFETGKFYLSDKNFLAQAILISTPEIEGVEDSQAMVGKVVSINLTKAMVNHILKGAEALTPDLFINETDGVNYILRKSLSEGRNTYLSSGFARKNSDVIFDDIKDGMVKLSSLGRTIPTPEEVGTLFEQVSGVVSDASYESIVKIAEETIALVERK